MPPFPAKSTILASVILEKFSVIFIAMGLLSHFGLDTKGQKFGPSSERIVYSFKVK